MACSPHRSLPFQKKRIYDSWATFFYRIYIVMFYIFLKTYCHPKEFCLHLLVDEVFVFLVHYPQSLCALSFCIVKNYSQCIAFTGMHFTYTMLHVYPIITLCSLLRTKLFGED